MYKAPRILIQPRASLSLNIHSNCDHKLTNFYSYPEPLEKQMTWKLNGFLNLEYERKISSSLELSLYVKVRVSI